MDMVITVTLFHNFCIFTDENIFDLAHNGMDQYFTDGFMDQMDAKKKARIHSSSLAGLGYVEPNRSKQSLRKQTGGYNLRKQKNSTSSDKASVSCKSKFKEKARDRTQCRQKMVTRSQNSRSLLFINETVKAKTQSSTRNAPKTTLKKEAPECEFDVVISCLRTPNLAWATSRDDIRFF